MIINCWWRWYGGLLSVHLINLLHRTCSNADSFVSGIWPLISPNHGNVKLLKSDFSKDLIYSLPCCWSLSKSWSWTRRTKTKVLWKSWMLFVLNSEWYWTSSNTVTNLLSMQLKAKCSQSNFNYNMIVMIRRNPMITRPPVL